ncbi:hypothetical protein [Burkholderia gladioli]|uniref:hypothetical protein n=1 Tax=Burkholderia gladioli TaxID=28095 RepID=UPI00164008D4|nr:hypothetical protein [Burkholderia gladioli]
MGACASYIEGELLTRFPADPEIVMSGQMAACCLGAAAIFCVAILPVAQRRAVWRAGDGRRATLPPWRWG